MKSWTVPRLYRRAILVYLAAIVAPVAAFVWLGIQTLERQRTIIVAQANDAVARELETRTAQAAKAAFTDLRHPIVQHTFGTPGSSPSSMRRDRPIRRVRTSTPRSSWRRERRE